MKKTLLTLISVMSITCSFAQNTPWATTGNIGIGTTTPLYPLDVSGVIRATGNIIAPTVNNQYIGYGANGDMKSLAIGTNVLGGTTGNIGVENIALGFNILNENTGAYNIGVGTYALSNNTTGNRNTGIGPYTLAGNTIGTQNIAIGYDAMMNNIAGIRSIAIGCSALYNNTGGLNTAIGFQSGSSSTVGTGNIFMGVFSGSTVTTGSNNTILGSSPTIKSLGVTTGSNNTIIGANLSSLSPTLANHIILADGSGQQRLVIDEGGKTGIGTTTPNVKLEVIGAFLAGGSEANLDPEAVGSINFMANSGKCLIGWNRSAIEGETDFISNQGVGTIGGFAFYNYSNDGVQTEILKLKPSGNVGIGMTNPDEKLSVNGTVHAREVKVNLDGWPDYVFKPNYDLMELSDVRTYVNENHHLPNIPSAAEVAKNGLKLGEMNSKLLQKVEELTLYVIDKDQQIRDQQTQLKHQQAQIDSLNQNQQAQILEQKNEIELLKQQFRSLTHPHKKSN